jgi:hypothetical protein
MPSVFGRNLQSETVRKWTPERNAMGHTPDHFKRAGVGTNGIRECKFLSETVHRALELGTGRRLGALASFATLVAAHPQGLQCLNGVDGGNR